MSQINVNTVNEYASANGVTVDGVLIKDGGIASTFITGLTSGLSSAQIFRLTTNTNNTTFLKLWEAPDNTPAQGSIGSVVSVDTSTGYFSFSETGKYIVTSSILMFYHGNSTISQQIIFSNDDFSSSTVFASKGFGAGYNSGAKAVDTSAILDIQNTTNDKFGIYSICNNTNSFCQGNTDQNMSMVQIIKLGET